MKRFVSIQAKCKIRGIFFLLFAYNNIRKGDVMEEWKQIILNEEITNYEVSTKGRVRNKKGQIIKQFDNGYGYLQVTLYFKSRKRAKKMLCRKT